MSHPGFTSSPERTRSHDGHCDEAGTCQRFSGSKNCERYFELFYYGSTAEPPEKLNRFLETRFDIPLRMSSKQRRLGKYLTQNQGRNNQRDPYSRQPAKQEVQSLPRTKEHGTSFKRIRFQDKDSRVTEEKELAKLKLLK